MIFGRWGTSKTMRDLRKTKKKLSLRNYAMTTEELIQESEKSIERLAKRFGRPIEVIDKPFK
jgi:predicted glycoside hydrolase/deacetylase ChbG (UPF0249 family)